MTKTLPLLLPLAWFGCCQEDELDPCCRSLPLPFAFAEGSSGLLSRIARFCVYSSLMTSSRNLLICSGLLMVHDLPIERAARHAAWLGFQTVRSFMTGGVEPSSFGMRAEKDPRLRSRSIFCFNGIVLWSWGPSVCSSSMRRAA